MVLMSAQKIAFFEQEAQMEILHKTVLQIQNKGINTFNDLVNFNKDTLKQIFNNPVDQQEGFRTQIQMLQWE